MKAKYKFAKIICHFLPPIMSQSVRNKIISIKEGEDLSQNFIKKSISGSKFFGNTSDFHAFKFSIHGYFDWRNIVLANKVLEFKKGNIIEVGANIGTETISFCDIASKHNFKVFAFEPVPSNVKSLTVNREKNNLNNLEIFNCLVSDSNGKAYFNIPTGNNSGSGFITNSKTNENTQEFDIFTLDKKLENEVISLISVDVEGFEYQVLKGGESIILKNKPVLILEVNKKYLEKRGNIKLIDFYNYLMSLGYDCYQIQKLGIKKIDLHKIKIQSNKNWVCIPKGDVKLVKKLNHTILANAFKPKMSIQ